MHNILFTMNLVEISYSTAFAALTVLLFFYSMLRYVSCISPGRRCLGSASIYHILLRYLIYPRRCLYLPFVTSISPLQTIIVFLYLGGTALCNFIGIQTPQEGATRAAHLSLINLCPLFLSGSHEFGAFMLGISLKTYGTIHRVAGLMAAIQAAIHVTLICQHTHFTPSNDVQYYGFLVSTLSINFMLLFYYNFIIPANLLLGWMHLSLSCVSSHDKTARI